jgi:acetyltransferase-like isoleucine patch superfamily enzyme
MSLIVFALIVSSPALAAAAVVAYDEHLLRKTWELTKRIYFMYIASTIFNREHLRVGEGSGWSQGCLFNCDGGLSIGRNVLIGPHVCIHTTNHVYSDVETPIKFQGDSPEPVIIEDDVWVGANCVILPGVKLGKGCVVGAGSIVTKSVLPYTVVVGNPAHMIKIRGEPECLSHVTKFSITAT